MIPLFQSATSNTTRCRAGLFRKKEWASSVGTDVRRPADDLLDVVRVLLLVQAAVLVATTIEAVIWGLAFRAPASTALLSGAAAAGLLVGRARLRTERAGSRRLIYVIEVFLLASLLIDALLAILLIGALPPPVALLTRLVVPLSVVGLLRHVARAAGQASGNAAAAA
jgi:hypothetical protein